jgi:carbon-monoxide dehydrogenase iron sulfur subunit
MRRILQFHPSKCIGCHSCELACSFKHGRIVNPKMARIFVEVDGSSHIPLTCFQCENPWCASVCPENAISRNLETGAMEVNEELCVGCGMCVKGCPFGLITLAPSQKAIKCNLCRGEPECVNACTYGALEFTTDETVISERRQLFFDILKKHSAVLNLLQRTLSYQGPKVIKSL